MQSEPVRSIASSKRIFSGPMDRLDPKSTRKVSLVSLTAPPIWQRNDTWGGHAYKAATWSQLPERAAGLKGYDVAEADQVRQVN